MSTNRWFTLLIVIALVTVVTLASSAGAAAPQVASIGKATLPKNLDRGPELPAASRANAAAQALAEHRLRESGGASNPVSPWDEVTLFEALAEHRARESGRAAYSDSVYARWVARAQKLWNATRGERQPPDNRACVLLCGGR